MRARLLPLLLAAIVLSGCSARSRRFASYQFAGKAPAMTCKEDGAARWCLHETKDAGPDLVYFLHYATGDERSWNRLGLSRAFYSEFKKLGRKAPRVVTVSYGSHWLMTNKPGRQTVLLKEFDELRRRIEDGLGPVERRFAWGMSQGGYNAAELVLSEPGLWSGAALSCPALYAVSPYAKLDKEVWARDVEGRQLFTHRMADDATWTAENPLALAAAAETLPPFWIEANPDDEFGFADGARALAKALRDAGGAATLVETPGGHCAIDARAAARFLATIQ